MAQKQVLDFDIDDALDEVYDPLADEGLDDDDELDFPVAGGDNLKLQESHVAPVPEHDVRPASVRIAELFNGMQARRKTLLAILKHCKEQQPVFDVADYIGVLKERDHSVYSANDFCNLLEHAGAIERVDQDGEPYREVELEPNIVVVDGVEYLEPNTPPPAFWRTTQAGLDYAQADDPQAQIQQIFEEEPIYLPIYKQVLTMCAESDGATAKALAKSIDSDPLLKRPRYYSSRFVEKLNRAGALEWAGKTWHITDSGLIALDSLANV